MCSNESKTIQSSIFEMNCESILSYFFIAWHWPSIFVSPEILYIFWSTSLEIGFISLLQIPCCSWAGQCMQLMQYIHEHLKRSKRLTCVLCTNLNLEKHSLKQFIKFDFFLKQLIKFEHFLIKNEKVSYYTPSTLDPKP